MARKLVDWKLKSESWRLGQRTYLIGALNVAPDSAETGGRFADPERALARAVEMAAQGADFIEVSAVAWAAGMKPVEDAEELRRLVPVLKRLKGRLAQPVIVETCKAAVAEKAAEHGAMALRDPSGLVLDVHLAKVAAQHDLGLIVGHMRGTPATWAKLPGMPDAMGTVIAELDAAVGRAKSGGVERIRMAVDPGFGMGKRKEQNTEILKHLGRLADAGLPVVVSTSSTAFASAVGQEAGLGSSVAAAALAVMNGAMMLRVDEVVEHRRAALLVDEVLEEPVAHRPAPGPKPKPEVVNRPVFADRRSRGPVRPPRRGPER